MDAKQCVHECLNELWMCVDSNKLLWRVTADYCKITIFFTNNAKT